MTTMLHVGDCREVLATLPAESVQCVVTSPPYYGLRDYGVAGQIGLEQSPAEYVAELVAVFREIRRVLRKDGCAFLNLGDSYANDGKWGGSSGGKHVKALHGDTSIGRGKKSTGLKPKDLMMIPNRVAIALQDDGWWVRSEIIWSKAAPMPERVRDRPTCAHEKVWLLTRSASYFYDADAVAEPLAEATLAGRRIGTERIGDYAATNAKLGDLPGSRRSARNAVGGSNGTRNLRNVWHLNPEPFPGAHFATMPPTLAERCIKAGSRVGATVLDPFAGAGTTLLVADRLQRHGVGIELNPEYIALARARLAGDAPLFAEVAA